MKNNKGMSLLEVVVAMAIMLVISGMILSVILASTRHYKAAGAEVDVQYEVQAAANQIQDLLMNAGTGICYQVDSQLAEKDSDCPDNGNTAAEKEVCIYRTEEEKQPDGTSQKRLMAEKVIWKKAEEKLYYSKYYCKKNADGTYQYQPVEEDCLLAEYVTSFSADLSQGEEHHQVDISLAFEKDGRKFNVKKEIALRNSIKINVPEATG